MRANHESGSYLYESLLQDARWEGTLRERALRVVGRRQHRDTGLWREAALVESMAAGLFPRLLLLLLLHLFLAAGLFAHALGGGV